ncbi:hypothetical protein FQN53_004537 [Emmonsiellopsis sp. PD_33]|nr:hypothetical protein FQN53_004537 [Emmonsiellopsis sp. PD_33]
MTRPWRHVRGLYLDLFHTRQLRFYRSRCFQFVPPRTSRLISFQPSPCHRQALPASGFEIIDHSRLVEEETLPGYFPEKYYPVSLGQVLHQRYRVVGKLGYGTTSTVWLAYDQEESKYAALKLYVTGSERTQELRVYDRFDSIETDHPGKRLIRQLLGSFEIQGPHGRHLCLVHEPLGINLDEALEYFPQRKFSLETLKPSLRQILVAFENAEYTRPIPRKPLKDRHIYLTRRMLPSTGLPFLCDFGEARFIDEAGTPGEDIMPDVYKAPEVMLQMKWDCKVDIWNIAMVVWHLVTGAPLFKGRSADGTFQDDRVHMAEISALIGPPPAAFLKRSPMCKALWEDDGTWRNVVPIPDISLEQLAADITGEDTEGFLRFFRRMLRWLPEERPTCQELVYDPWLMKGLGDKRS